MSSCSYSRCVFFSHYAFEYAAMYSNAEIILNGVTIYERAVFALDLYKPTEANMREAQLRNGNHDKLVDQRQTDKLSVLLNKNDEPSATVTSGDPPTSGQVVTAANLLAEYQKKKKERMKFSCDRCDFETTGQSLLQRHKNSSEYVNNEMYSCDKCAITSCVKIGVARHKNAAHPEGNLFKCPICSKPYATQKALNQHKRDKHPVVEKKEESAIEREDRKKEKALRMKKLKEESAIEREDRKKEEAKLRMRKIRAEKKKNKDTTTAK